jgi:hypothetical protein
LANGGPQKAQNENCCRQLSNSHFDEAGHLHVGSAHSARPDLGPAALDPANGPLKFKVLHGTNILFLYINLFNMRGLLYFLKSNH